MSWTISSDHIPMDNTHTSNYFTTGIRTHREFEEMMLRKRIQTKNRCFYCRKILNGKIYKVKAGDENQVNVCSHCKFLYDLIYREIITNNNDKTIKLLFSLTYNDYNHTRAYKIIDWKKTRRQGIFIKPSKMGSNYLSTTYTRMVKKCCRCCEKQFIKTYTAIEGEGRKEIRMCRNCSYLFKIFLRERNNNNGSHVEKMRNHIRLKKRL